jgi:tetratricopeptide (TPR) repeat protein
VPIGLRPAPAGGARSVRDRLARTPSAIALVTAISLIGLVVAWMVFQPLRSSNADGAGVTASLNGAAPAAIADASAAATYDPVSVDPLFELAALYQSTGDNDSAEAELLKAIALQPNTPNTWLQNAELLIQLHRPDQALRDVKRAGQLDIGSSTVVDTQIAAEQELKR